MSQLIYNKKVKEKRSWEEMFEKLKEYKSKYGNINMKASSDFVYNLKLGRWVNNQKLYYKHYRAGNRNKRSYRGMCQSRIEKFQSIGFELRPAEEGEEEEGEVVGSGSGSGVLHESRSLSPLLSSSQPKKKMKKDGKEESWEVMYEKLVDFQYKFGHINVPPPVERECYAKLHDWVLSQCKEYKQYMVMKYEATRKGTMKKPNLPRPKLAMTEKQFEILTQIGFEVLVDNDEEDESSSSEEDYGKEEGKKVVEESPEWESKYERLIKYKELHGDANVPRRYRSDPKLGKWVDTQRTGYKSFRKGLKKSLSGMNENRIQRLENLGFLWSMKGVKVNTLPYAKRVTKVKKSNPEVAERKAVIKNQCRKDCKLSASQNEFPQQKRKMKEESTEQKSVAEIILRKYNLYKGPMKYKMFKTLSHYYYLKNNKLLNR